MDRGVEAVGGGSAVAAGDLQLRLFGLDDIVSEGAGRLRAADGIVLQVVQRYIKLGLTWCQEFRICPFHSNFLFPLLCHLVFALSNRSCFSRTGVEVIIAVIQLAFLVCIFGIFFFVRTHNEAGAFGRFTFCLGWCRGFVLKEDHLP